MNETVQVDQKVEIWEMSFASSRTRSKVAYEVLDWRGGKGRMGE